AHILNLVDGVVRARELVPNFHQQLELLLEIRGSRIDPGIEFYLQGSGLAFAVDSQPHLILPGQSKRTASAFFVLVQIVVGNAAGALIAHIPKETVETSF